MEAEPEFDLRKNLAERLFTPIPPAPMRPSSLREFRSHPYIVQGRAIRAIRTRNMRALAPELARYLKLPEEQAATQFLAAEIFAGWGYCEGIKWLIEWVDNDESEGNRMFAIRTLGRACGVNFFSDKKRWRAWWKANRHRFPSAMDK